MTKMLDNLTNTPALFHSVSYASVSDSESLRPAANTKGDSVVSKHGRAFTIIHLFLWSCPPTVCCPSVQDALFAMSARIVAVTINAIYRVSVARLVAHVLEEVDERFSPPIAYHNTTSSIDFVAVLTGAITSIFGSLLAFSPVTASGSSPIFDVVRQLIRIFRSHLTFPENDWVDRAESVCNTASARFILA